MRHYVARTLEMTGIGMSIDQAANGMEAMQKARIEPPNLIITDLNMPGMTGNELIEQASADERLRHVPFLVVTADGNSQLGEGADSAARRFTCLTKPVPPGVLRSSLLNVLEQTSLESTVLHALQSVVETMFFSEAEYRGAGPVAAPAIGARVEFTGPVDGLLDLFLEEKLAARLGADFMAIDASEAEPALGGQTVTELANILSARILNAWLPGSCFRYSLPRDVESPQPGTRHRFTFSAGSEEADLALDLTILK
jgi:two-component system chemotaxis response regulator CheY